MKPSQRDAHNGSVATVVHGARVPRGAPATLLQVPFVPSTSQAWHCPSQLLSQQTPSTQNPVPQSAWAVHCAPLLFLQVPFAVVSGPAQVSSVAHVAEPQQNPSTHVRPPAHVGPAQGAPCNPDDTHCFPIEHENSPFPPQSALVSHVVLHAEPAHAYAPHGVLVAEHRPLLHVPVAWYDHSPDPASRTHAPAPHAVELPT